jgi:alanine racemase
LAGLPSLPRTAWLEVDLDRLTANLAAIRGLLPEGVSVEPVVKADAYGHGATMVASWLEHAGASGLCVATLDEGLELRAAGVGLPILVLYPIPPDGVAAALAARLAVTAADVTLLQRTLAARVAVSDGSSASLVVHIEVETGLGRAGIAPADLPNAIAAIRATPGVELAGVWSHLAAPTDAARTGRQVATFEAAVAAGWPDARPIRHLAATGGLLAATVPAYDRVRLGLGLYGIVPDGLVPGGEGGERGAATSGPAAAGAAAALRPVMSIHARPIRVADLPAGHGVSYGPSFETARPSRIATLPLGYGDGWPRSLSNRAEALVRGRRVPLVGTVAMDAVLADVTDVPGPPVTVDDAFVLLGEQSGPLGTAAIGAAELAHERTTITWEVVTQMARRLPRVYHAAAVPVGVRTLTEEIRLWPPESNAGTGISSTSKSTRS